MILIEQEEIWRTGSIVGACHFLCFVVEVRKYKTHFARLLCQPDELEGYEDLHASAELRRDILRNLAPVVIEEALACAA